MPTGAEATKLKPITNKTAQPRWKSKLMWAAVVAQLVVIGQITGLWAAIGVQQDTISNTAAAVLQLLVVVGVFNDPTNAKGW